MTQKDVTDITSNHGQPIQYFKCPFCDNTVHNYYEGCECGASFKLVAEK